MGFLSDAAKRGFNRAGGGAYVPTWYKSTVMVGGVFIVGILAYTALTSERPEPVQTGGPVVVIDDNKNPASSGSTTLPLVGGVTVDVPESAYAAAEAAASAIWTGNWSDVPVDGELPDVSATFPDAVVGQASVLSSGADSISFLFSLDEEGNGSWDQDFQVTVVNGSSGWTYPSYIG